MRKARRTSPASSRCRKPSARRQGISRPARSDNPTLTQTLAEKRAQTDAMQLHDSEQNRALYPVNIASSTIAGIPVRIVTPIDSHSSRQG